MSLDDLISSFSKFTLTQSGDAAKAAWKNAFPAAVRDGLIEEMTRYSEEGFDAALRFWVRDNSVFQAFAAAVLGGDVTAAKKAAVDKHNEDHRELAPEYQQGYGEMVERHVTTLSKMISSRVFSREWFDVIARGDALPAAEFARHFDIGQTVRLELLTAFSTMNRYVPIHYARHKREKLLKAGASPNDIVSYVLCVRLDPAAPRYFLWTAGMKDVYAPSIDNAWQCEVIVPRGFRYQVLKLEDLQTDGPRLVRVVGKQVL